MDNERIVQALNNAVSTIDDMKSVIEEMTPAYNFGLMALGDNNSFSMKQAADILAKKTGLGRNDLMDWLRREDILLSTHNYWNQPARAYIERGYFETVEKATPIGMKMVTVVTNKGIEFIMRKWDERTAKLHA